MKYLGSEYKLYVGDGEETEVFTVIAGQTGLSFDVSTNFIDTSSKSTGRIGTQRPGRRAITITCSGKMELPDAKGLEEVFSLSKADPSLPANFQIRQTPFAADDVVFQGSMYVGGMSQDMPDEDNATWSFELTPAAAPTTELLVPAA